MKVRRRGSILIVVVGILTLLVLLTMSVSRKTNQELVLVKYSLQKMKARYLAWAGFHYTLSHLREDTLDDASGAYDDHFACGVKITDDMTPEQIFKEVRVGEGWFTVVPGSGAERFGMGDEDGKLNLNALDLQNYKILQELFVDTGLQEDDAVQLAAAVVDWRDEDTQPVLDTDQKQEGPFGFEKKQFRAKDRPFDHVQELLFIEGITPELYEKIKPFVTVFPRRAGKLNINLATAPVEVLSATAKFFSGPQSNTSRNDAESLVRKIMALRAGDDRIEGTADDQRLAENKMALTASEEILFRAMMQYESKTSQFLTFRVNGFAGADRRQSHIDAIVDRKTLTIVSWRND